MFFLVRCIFIEKRENNTRVKYIDRFKLTIFSHHKTDHELHMRGYIMIRNKCFSALHIFKCFHDLDFSIHMFNT